MSHQTWPIHDDRPPPLFPSLQGYGWRCSCGACNAVSFESMAAAAHDAQEHMARSEQQ